MCDLGQTLAKIKSKSTSLTKSIVLVLQIAKNEHTLFDVMHCYNAPHQTRDVDHIGQYRPIYFRRWSNITTIKIFGQCLLLAGIP